MAMMKYDPKNPKCEALVKAGLMEPKHEGGPQVVTKEPEKQRQERSQAG